MLFTLNMAMDAEEGVKPQQTINILVSKQLKIRLINQRI